MGGFVFVQTFGVNLDRFFKLVFMIALFITRSSSFPGSSFLTLKEKDATGRALVAKSKTTALGGANKKAAVQNGLGWWRRRRRRRRRLPVLHIHHVYHPPVVRTVRHVTVIRHPAKPAPPPPPGHCSDGDVRIRPHTRFGPNIPMWPEVYDGASSKFGGGRRFCQKCFWKCLFM